MRVYFDSCIAIYLVEFTDPWYERIQDWMNTNSEIETVVSDLVRLESLVFPVRHGNKALIGQFRQFFRVHVPRRLSATAFEHATRLRAEHNLKTPDALHIGAAIAAGCDEFWTNDHRLDRIPLPLAVRAFED